MKEEEVCYLIIWNIIMKRMYIIRKTYKIDEVSCFYFWIKNKVIVEEKESDDDDDDDKCKCRIGLKPIESA